MTQERLTIDWDQLRAAFAEESRELIAALESASLALEASPHETTHLHEAFRAVHSIKGAAATLGMGAIAELSHDLETMLDAWRNAELTPTPAHFAALLTTVDALKSLLSGSDDDVDVHAGLRASLVALTASSAAPVVEPAQADGALLPPSAYRIRFALASDAFKFGGDPSLVLREVADLAASIEVQLDVSRLPALDRLVADEAYLAWTLHVVPQAGVDEARLREAFSFFDGVCELAVEGVRAERASGQLTAPAASALPTSAPAALAEPSAEATRSDKAQERATIRVATDKVDRVIDLVGELVIAQSAVRELARTYRPENIVSLQEALLVSERHLRDLQERVMSVRMVSVGSVFARLPRVVRDVSQKLGKEVALDMQGAETELDKSLAERLTDPLLHLVRNALDHGIEASAVRQAHGKPARATLKVCAYARGGSVFVEVIDDGKGLDRERIRARAIERGLVAADAPLSEDQVLKLICSPGFSTKDQATDLSGRGVGLDVVASNLQALGGDLQIESEPNRGTRFSMRLPLTLGIMDCLVLSAGGEPCVLPVSDVAFSLQIAPGQTRILAGCAEVIDLPSETLPLLDLAQILRASSVGSFGPELAVVVHAGAYRYALRVDALQGQMQAVVKSLETHYRRVAGVMGATILGNGRVALILDGQGIAQNAGLRRHAERGKSKEGGQWLQPST